MNNKNEKTPELEPFFGEYANACFSNGDRWKKDATALMNTGSYGHGCALLRFSREEIDYHSFLKK